jgi:hypothetical protein
VPGGLEGWYPNGLWRFGLTPGDALEEFLHKVAGGIRVLDHEVVAEAGQLLEAGAGQRSGDQQELDPIELSALRAAQQEGGAGNLRG